MKVLVTEKLSPAGMKLLTEHFEVEERLDLKVDQLKEALSTATAIIVRSKTRLTADVLSAGRSLRVIGRAGVGYDNIDLKAASRQGILVMNVPEGSTISACEHTLALLLALVRRIPDAVAGIRAGRWRRDLVGNELYGRTLGVVGLGRIGAEVARRALTFGMKVIGHDPFLAPERAQTLGLHLVPLDTLLTDSDVITLHIPATDATRKIISRRELSLMKQGSFLVNCARGALIDEEALVEALRSGHLGGAALDVFTTEPPDFGTPLFSSELPNLIATPHLGASTEEAQEKVALIIAQQISRALLEDDFMNSVNLPYVPPEMMRRLRPYLELAEGLAGFAVQWLKNMTGPVQLAFEGEAASVDTGYVALGLQKGLLDQVADEPITYVNAPIIAHERGISVVLVKRESTAAFKGALVLSARGGGDPARALELIGVASPEGEPRLVGLDGYSLDFPLAGRFLLIEHRDQPGVVGKVGTLLGDKGVNIDRMQVCRRTAGQAAMMILTVDNEIPRDVTDRLAATPGVARVTVINISGS
ncbi:MAG: phosphoglycerate dehydrogenase [Candidatus Riflebacteria bacterium]|nr:phosphoglycerate dehydrogenase [Candidatus Riflebacteria bacterium]